MQVTHLLLLTHPYVLGWSCVIASPLSFTKQKFTPSLRRPDNRKSNDLPNFFISRKYDQFFAEKVEEIKMFGAKNDETNFELAAIFSIIGSKRTKG